MTIHIPVMVDEVIRNLELRPGIYIDATLGGGGYLKRILEVVKDSVVIGIDQDIESIEIVAKNLGMEFKESSLSINGSNSKMYTSTDSGRNTTVFLVNSNFNNLIQILRELNLEGQDLVSLVADLGFSSDQLERGRGFSYMKEEEELDMRMDLSLGIKAKDFLNALGKSELTNIFRNYGDEPKAEKLALFIVEQRKIKTFESVKDLNSILYKLKYGKDETVDVRRRIFQALRIAVNFEFDALRGLLESAYSVMTEGSKVMIVSFHSGEDRIVKDFVREKKLKNIFSDYLTPSEEEVRRNVRSRSAKLRGFTK